ncbi:MAG: DNA polymerase III subunit gamma/tau, partial [Bacteriovoracaceae bacterium]|nr:DNA polymerase III subunit gamma/tau [Bacteriovoracaceae bacterium]
MGYQVLARKWRPKTFNEVIGQDHIARTLQNSILKEKIAHAYLFTGTRGVGKTTIARIFAKAIRCENLDDKGNPCLECSSCKSIDQSNALDYVEIDGASNNSVDNIRELIENAQYLPSSGKYKVYVVDEVHMLSTSAFNALLKTLEEPPAHVIFIFATTDPHKLLGTVLSRCQRFDFKHVSVETLTAHIKNIASLENISFESEESIKILARQGNGSVRDTLSLMDQALSLSAEESISEETLLQSLGLARADSIKELASSILFKNPVEALKVFDEITLDSVELEKLSNQILDKIFLIIENIDNAKALSEHLVDSNLDIDTAELMWVYEVLLKDFEWGLQSFDPLRSLRFSLLKVCKRDEIVGAGSGQVKKKSNKLETSSAPIEVETKAAQPVEAPEQDVQKLETQEQQVQNVEAQEKKEARVEDLKSSVDAMVK